MTSADDQMTPQPDPADVVPPQAGSSDVPGDARQATNGSDDDALAQAEAIINAADVSSTPDAEQLLAERTDDLQRVQAEYANYRKRVERDKAVSKQQGAASVVKELMPILDAIAKASEHEELTGGFKAVAGEFARLCEKFGLVQFGAIGDEFDPALHEALMQIPAPDVEPGRIAQVVQPGYILGDVVLRPARVAIAAAAE